MSKPIKESLPKETEFIKKSTAYEQEKIEQVILTEEQLFIVGNMTSAGTSLKDAIKFVTKK